MKIGILILNSRIEYLIMNFAMLILNNILFVVAIYCVLLCLLFDMLYLTVSLHLQHRGKAACIPPSQTALVRLHCVSCCCIRTETLINQVPSAEVQILGELAGERIPSDLFNLHLIGFVLHTI